MEGEEPDPSEIVLTAGEPSGSRLGKIIGGIKRKAVQYQPYLEELSWKLVENDYATILHEAGISDEKMDAALEVVRWFEDHTKGVRIVKVKNDKSDPYRPSKYRDEHVDVPYRLQRDDISSLAEYINAYPDGAKLLGKVLNATVGIERHHSFTKFLEYMVFLSKLPNVEQALDALAKIGGVRKVDFSSISLLRDEDYKVIEASYRYPERLTDPIRELSQLSASGELERSLSEDVIARIRQIPEKLESGRGTPFLPHPEDIPQLLEVAKNQTTFDFFIRSMQRATGSSPYDYKFSGYLERFIWVNKHLPELARLDAMGFATASICSGMMHADFGLRENFRSREELVGFLTGSGDVYGIGEVDEVASDGKFCRNATIVYNLLGTRVGPHYNQGIKWDAGAGATVPANDFFEVDDPEEVSKVLTFYNLRKKIFQLKNPKRLDWEESDLELLTTYRHYDNLKELLKNYTEEELVAVFGNLSPGSFDYFLGEDEIWKHEIAGRICQALLSGGDIEAVKRRVAILGSTKVQDAAKQAEWAFAMFPVYESGLTGQVPSKVMLARFLLEGDGAESQLARLGKIAGNQEAVIRAKSILESRGVFFCSSIDLALLEMLPAVPDEQMDKVINFYRAAGGVYGYTMARASGQSLEKVLYFLTLSQDVQYKLETLMRSQSPGATVSVYILLQEKVSLEKIKFLVSNFDEAARVCGGLGTPYSRPLDFVNDFDRTVDFCQTVKENPKIFDAITQLSKGAGYIFTLQDAGSIKNLVAEPKVLETIFRLGGAGYVFKGGHLPMMRSLTEKPEICRFILDMSRNGYTFEPGDWDGLTEIYNDPSLKRFVLILAGFGYMFVPEHLGALKNLAKSPDRILGLLREKPDFCSDFFANIKFLENMSPSNIEGFISVVDKIQSSQSKDVQQLQSQLIHEIANSPDPEKAWAQIEGVFLRNNLPIFGKILKVFQILNPPQTMQEKLHKSGATLSPVLVNASDQERLRIVSTDLLNIHILTGNMSLRNYLLAIQEGEGVFDQAEREGLDSLPAVKRVLLERFLTRMDTIFATQLKQAGRGQVTVRTEGRTQDQAVLRRMEMLKRRMGVVGGNGSFSEKLHRIFLQPSGYRSVGEVLWASDAAKLEADTRNRGYAARGHLDINAGDLLKGVWHSYVTSQMQNGIVSNEYFGNDSDSTPFDADTSKVLESDTEGKIGEEKFRSAVDSSLAIGYGDMLLLIRDRGVFQKNLPYNPLGYQIGCYETFNSLVYGERHWGIRTGIPFTEVSAVIAKEEIRNNIAEMQRLYFQIAQNGFYIPVADEAGTVLFTENDYEGYRLKLDAISPVLDSDTMEPHELIGLLKQNPYLASLFGASAGVSEGWTIEQHTGMVLNQFERLLESGGFNINWTSRRLFRLILGLHDIGKSISVEKTGSTQEQHEYTKEVTEPLFEALGLSNGDVNLAVAVVTQDFIGHFINPTHGQGAENVAYEIRKTANSLGLPAAEFFELLKVYYLCDASSYTRHASFTTADGAVLQGKASLERLFDFRTDGSLTFSADTAGKLETLRQLVAA